MKKILTYFTLLFSVCVLSGFSSCKGPQFEEAELTGMEERGKMLMQEWLDEHIPGAEVRTASAYINMIPSGPEYLTDSVYGTFSCDGEEQDYEVEVEEEAVYLPGDKRFFYERVKPYALESLGLSDQKEGYGFERGSTGMLCVGSEQYTPGMPYYGSDDTGLIPGELALKLREADPDSAAAFKAHAGMDGDQETKSAKVLPEEDQEDTAQISWNDEACAIMDDFIRNPESRPIINISGFIDVPAEIELKDYDMAFFDSLKETAGLYCSFVELYQDFMRDASDPVSPESMGIISAEVTCSGWDTSYERFVRQPFEDFYIEYQEEYYSEVSRDGKVTLEEQHTNDAEYLRMDRTKEGYGFSFTNDDWFLFYIITDGSSELFGHEYINRYDQAANLGPGDRYGGDRYIDRDLEWSQRDDGLWTLTNPDGVYSWFSNADELIIKDDPPVSIS
ncbi:MAG: hypothetical protein K5770_18100 [Lachnospiraceae bacterium]|nr:hypothetical protein [Lachnospiraceae bacterium]